MFSNIKIGNHVRKKKRSKFVPLEKRRRKEAREDPNLVANGRFQCLVALGRFHALWPLEGKKETSFSPLFIPPPNKILNLFSLILRFYFIMVLDHYFKFFLPFP
jgi:hypothetical protein